jgi:hypothetical protein
VTPRKRKRKRQGVKLIKVEVRKEVRCGEREEVKGGND